MGGGDKVIGVGIGGVGPGWFTFSTGDFLRSGGVIFVTRSRPQGSAIRRDFILYLKYSRLWWPFTRTKAKLRRGLCKRLSSRIEGGW